MQTVADSLREVGVAGLIAKSLGKISLVTGCDGTGTQDDGIVLVERVACHAALQFVVGDQRLVVHAQCHLRGGNEAPGGKSLPIAAVVKERQVFLRQT